MYSEHRLLEVHDPDSNQYTMRLEQSRFTIGRSNDNDIVLPNADKTISRFHCVLENEANSWWVVDDSSANGTFVQRDDSETRIDVRQQGRLQLKHGDVILILGKLLAGDEPVFWKLVFRDSEATGKPEGYQSPPYLEYSLSQKKLFLVNDREREEIHLSRKERNLVHYMAESNQANNNQPMVCEYQELTKAIWGDVFGHTNNDVTRLVWVIRRKVELDSGEPKFLKTEQGRGYSLKVKLLT